MKLAAQIIKAIGWKVYASVPDFPKCVICVAPHTSNWDFILGKLAYAALGREAGFLMKESWFFPPLSFIFRAMGGIPVPPKSGSDLTDAIVDKFNSCSKMSLAVTPEGTRKLVKRWRKGFIYIALGAKIPIVLAYIDYAKKEIGLTEVLYPSEDIDANMSIIRRFYDGRVGKYPEKFSVEE